MQNKVKVLWCNTANLEAVANAYGYNTMIKNIIEFSEPYAQASVDADIYIHMVPGDKFKPVPGKFNVLFTMWEFMDVPKSYTISLNRADMVIVPSSFCRDVFSKYTTTPIRVCHLGVDPEKFKFHARRPPAGADGKFRFLWVGAPNPRKGYPIVLEALKVFEGSKNVEIYLKTSAPNNDLKTTLKNAWRNRKEIMFDGKKLRALNSMIRRFPHSKYSRQVQVMGKHKNVFMDMRKLPLDELIELYNSAHCFILPNLGEGWGLTLSEAMATGCPCIANGETGCADFFNEKVGYPIRTEIYKQDMTEQYDIMTNGYVPDALDMVKKMIDVIARYDEALRRGIAASERIRTKFTWKQSGARMGQILREIEGGLMSQRKAS